MLSFLLILISALFFPGIIAQTKAKMSGRKGAGLLQPLRDMWRLFRKGNVYSTSSSFIFQIGGIVFFASVIMSILIVPFGDQHSVIFFQGDMVFFAYALGLGKFLLIAAALDIGSGFEGMGANREVLYSLLVEPAFFIIVGSVALLTGYSSFSDIFAHLHVSGYVGDVFGAMAIYLLVQIAMIENSRLPVDDPRTHLELTMVHEVMVLDHSGFDLALIQLGTTLKFALYGGLIANFVLPIGSPLPGQIVLYLGIQMLFAITVGLLESFRARNKLSKNPRFMATLIAVSIVAFFTVLIITQTFAN